MLCSYGCNQNANFKTTSGKDCCVESYRKCPAVLVRNKAGTKLARDEGRKGYTHNPNSAGKGRYTISNEKLFVEAGQHTTEFIKNRIEAEELLEYKCAECGINSWRDKQIVLELDHINGINNDNRLENLRYLCPNCHSQTETFRGRNKNTGVVKVTDLEILQAYQKHGNIRQALIAVGLVPKGGNYERVKRILAKDLNESVDK